MKAKLKEFTIIVDYPSITDAVMEKAKELFPDQDLEIMDVEDYTDEGIVFTIKIKEEEALDVEVMDRPNSTSESFAPS